MARDRTRTKVMIDSLKKGGDPEPERKQVMRNRRDRRRGFVTQHYLKPRRSPRAWPMTGPLGTVTKPAKPARLTGAQARHAKHGTRPWRRGSIPPVYVDELSRVS